MRKFWGLYDNGTYRVGCNGATVYLFDMHNNELARFKDINYAYSGAFHPSRNNIIVIKSTAGTLAVYDLDKRALVKKIIVTNIGAQDEGFAFSADGKLFYNIEKPVISYRTQLSIYDAKDFNLIKTLFADNRELFLETIEFDKESNKCYVLGHNNKDYFIGLLESENIINAKRISENWYYYICHYKSWEEQGFTEKALQWNALKNMNEIKKVSLKSAYEELPADVIF